MSCDGSPFSQIKDMKTMKDTKYYLKYLSEVIHTTVLATVDDNSLPVTCAVDIMDYDENSLYFLTAKGKSLYHRLVSREFVSLTALQGTDTIHSIAVSVRGKVREIGNQRINDLFEKNKYMYEIYPTEESIHALTVFQIYEGSGEWFDLSKKPIERVSFTFGGAEKTESGYFVTDNCIGCESCILVCPQKCIDMIDNKAVIRQNNCLRCGNCAEICPVGAVVKR